MQLGTTTKPEPESASTALGPPLRPMVSVQRPAQPNLPTSYTTAQRRLIPAVVVLTQCARGLQHRPP
jgi:hypothetical protein